METAFILAGIIALSCILFSRASNSFGVPALLIFMVLGMLFGTDGIVGLQFSDYTLTENLCTIGLVFIMFYGGFLTSWKAAKPVSVQAGLLSSLGTIATALIVAGLVHVLLGFKLVESFLLGAVISSTDAASVFSILQSKQLNLKGGLASLLEVESGSNDPFAYLLTFVGILLMGGSITAGETAMVVIQQVVLGALGGVIIAILSIIIFRYLSFGDNGLDMIFIMAIALMAYGLPSFLGGNGFLAVYIAGIIVGNSPLSHKIELIHFLDGLTKLSQMVIFFLFGLLAFPSRLPMMFIPAVVTVLVMTFIARPIAMTLLLKPFGRSFKEIVFVSTAGLRGAASLVFAVIAISQLTQAGTPISFDLYHTVFWIVLFSIAIQGTIIPFVAKKLDLVDDTQSVMKTFTDYEEEGDFNLVEHLIAEGGQWDQKKISELKMPPETLIVLVKRGDETIIPQGSTKLQAGDLVVMNHPSYKTMVKDLALTELPLEGKHPWVNHLLKDIKITPQAMIVMIRRDQENIIPDGTTRLLQGDTLVISGKVPTDPQAALRA